MKTLFCTVVTDFNGILEEPIVYHTKASSVIEVNQRVAEELEELGWDYDEIPELFEICTFEVTNSKIEEI